MQRNYVGFFLGIGYSQVRVELLNIEGGIAFNVVDGVFRLAIFLAYIFLIARWKEMRRRP